MRVALVHDYLREYGGAERVLAVLAAMFPRAPIYTAFADHRSFAYQAFSRHPIRESSLSWLLKRGRLYSPLRFFMPVIWRHFDLSDFDLVITSCSGYIARGFKKGPQTKVIAYCHTPPRFLYGYRTSIDWQKYGIVRLYALIVNHFLRLFDFRAASEVDLWLVNSVNVQKRVAKFYRQPSLVVYPPVAVEKFIKASQKKEKKDYFLIVSRLVGAKGLEEAAQAARKLGFRLKIAGGGGGFNKMKEKLIRLGGGKVTLLGRVSDQELALLYAEAKGFLALARDEDFGMTVVEAQAAGTPVIAFNGGGFKESVIDGRTGILINDTSVRAIGQAMRRFNKIKWEKKVLQEQARKFSRENFEKKIKQAIKRVVK